MKHINRLCFKLNNCLSASKKNTKVTLSSETLNNFAIECLLNTTMPNMALPYYEFLTAGQNKQS